MFRIFRAGTRISGGEPSEPRPGEPSERARSKLRQSTSQMPVKSVRQRANLSTARQGESEQGEQGEQGEKVNKVRTHNRLALPFLGSFYLSSSQDSPSSHAPNHGGRRVPRANERARTLPRPATAFFRPSAAVGKSSGQVSK